MEKYDVLVNMTIKSGEHFYENAGGHNILNYIINVQRLQAYTFYLLFF